MGVTKQFEKWALGYSGCCGGDIGSEAQPSVWVCGIEWGTGHSAEMLESEMRRNLGTPPNGYSDWAFNLQHRFNWQAVKLLTALEGGEVSSYKTFAESRKPFCVDGQGYFKANLYPIAFKNTNHALWKDQFASLTGLRDKGEYLNWCSQHRLPQMRQWAANAKPKLIICLGKSYLNEFSEAFADGISDFMYERIEGRQLAWKFNSDGTLVAILPFMGGRNGLVRNTTIQEFGSKLKSQLEKR